MVKAATEADTASKTVVISISEKAAASDVAAADDNAEPRQDVVRKKELFDHVAEVTGQRKKDVREVIEAALAFMRTSLLDEKEVFAAPLGKLKVKRANAGSAKEKMVYRIKLHQPGQKAEEEA